jgi:isoquinoline 1-oxidoreductase alpha subunit
MTSMTVNGEAVRYRLDPQTPLLWALRDASNLTGTKYGCDSKDCGACTVIVDGRAVTSCSVTLASLEGADITTVEGLSADRAHPVQQAWAVEQVSQCGFCEPGFIMAIAALLKASPVPDAGQIAGIPNICRCGAYPRIRQAIDRAARQAVASTNPEQQAPARLSLTSSEKEHVPPTTRP